MIVNESIVDDAALILPAATLTRPLLRGEGGARGCLAAESGHPRGGAGNYSGLSNRSI